MKLFKDQTRIPDYAWLYNHREKRTFIVLHKNFAGIDKTFRVESYSILEVLSKEAINIKYEIMENLIENKTLQIL
jgi:hypothetical protein